MSRPTINIDARPFLLRDRENIWERTQKLRSNLYELIEDKCRMLKVEALVLQSGPYEHPAWVKFESWFPSENKAITMRSSMTVTIYTKPFHQFESIYGIDWHKLGHEGKVIEVYKFGEKEIGEIIDFLCFFDKGMIWPGKVNAILKPVQLRQKWWQFLKPKNHIKSLKFDLILPGSVALVIIGWILIAVALNSKQLGSYIDPIYESSSEYETDSLVKVDSTLMEDSYVETEEGMSPINQELYGVLEESDLMLEDEKFYDVWGFSAEIGEEFSISMYSDQFDTQLFLYEVINENYILIDSNDDHSTDDTNSLINFVSPNSKDFVVIASSAAPKNFGVYNLLIQKK